MSAPEDVFVVRSPFQVVNAAEAAAVYGSTSVGVCLLRSRAEEMVQVEGILERTGLAGVERVDSVDEYLDRHPGPAGRVFLGDYREPDQRRLARHLGVERPILLDDGNATLMVARRRERRAWRLSDRRDMSLSAHSHQRRLPVPTLARDLARPAERENRSVEFFSIYRVRGGRHDTYRPNTLAWLRSQIEVPVATRPVFIGSSLIDTGIMHAAAYRERVATAAAASDGALLYIAHRKESDANVDRLRHDHGVEVLRPDVPIELVLLERRIEPSRIWAVLSSAFDTLRMIFPGVPASTDPPRPDEVVEAFRTPMARMVALTRSTTLATPEPRADR